MPDTTDHQMTVWVPTSSCFCTTWGKQNKQNITLLCKTIWLLN